MSRQVNAERAFDLGAAHGTNRERRAATTEADVTAGDKLNFRGPRPAHDALAPFLDCRAIGAQDRLHFRQLFVDGISLGQQTVGVVQTGVNTLWGRLVSAAGLVGLRRLKWQSPRGADNQVNPIKRQTHTPEGTCVLEQGFTCSSTISYTPAGPNSGCIK